MSHQSAKAFSLAELMIALTILAEIATFTIPKVLASQQKSRYIAMAKQSISMVSEAYAIHKSKGLLTQDTSAPDLSPYLNYVSVATTSAQTIDGNYNCDVWEPCLNLHDGSRLFLRGPSFGGTAQNRAISFFYDPDPAKDGTGMLTIWIYYNGRVTTDVGILNPTYDEQNFAFTPGPDPDWFVWN